MEPSQQSLNAIRILPHLTQHCQLPRIIFFHQTLPDAAGDVIRTAGISVPVGPLNALTRDPGGPGNGNEIGGLVGLHGGPAPPRREARFQNGGRRARSGMGYGDNHGARAFPGPSPAGRRGCLRRGCLRRRGGQDSVPPAQALPLLLPASVFPCSCSRPSSVFPSFPSSLLLYVCLYMVDSSSSIPFYPSPLPPFPISPGGGRSIA